MFLDRILGELFRSDGRRILASIARLTGDLTLAEDALQEACARALVAWSRDGLPKQPAAWLNTVARRIAIDGARRDRSAELPEDLAIPAHELIDPQSIEDDRLRLVFVCCHPALPLDARCALALRALGGLSTREIARAYVEPEATTAQRIVRAKKKIAEARIPFEVPPAHRLSERTDTVLEVLYLIFNEGYSSTEAESLTRPDLVAEAIRLARLTADLLADSCEARGLLALMLLTDARTPARVDGAGDLVPLEEQDRTLWKRSQVEEGLRILEDTLGRRDPGPYQTQAAIAAVHASARTTAETDWNQIAALYRTLLRWTPTPIVELNAAIASGMANGLEPALDEIARIERSGALRNYHLLPAAKADVLRRLGRLAEAGEAYRQAAAMATSPAETRYLERRLRETSASSDSEER